MIFRGTIRDSHFRAYNPQSLKAFMDKWEGRKVSVDIKGSTRSNEQNSYYWGVVVALLSEHTGYTPEEIPQGEVSKKAIYCHWR